MILFPRSLSLYHGFRKICSSSTLKVKNLAWSQWTVQGIVSSLDKGESNLSCRGVPQKGQPECSCLINIACVIYTTEYGLSVNCLFVWQNLVSYIVMRLVELCKDWPVCEDLFKMIHTSSVEKIRYACGHVPLPIFTPCEADALIAGYIIMTQHRSSLKLLAVWNLWNLCTVSWVWHTALN